MLANARSVMASVWATPPPRGGQVAVMPSGVVPNLGGVVLADERLLQTLAHVEQCRVVLAQPARPLRSLCSGAEVFTLATAGTVELLGQQGDLGLRNDQITLVGV